MHLDLAKRFGTVRVFLLAIFALQAAGTSAELLLMGHFADVWQLVPVALMLPSLALLVVYGCFPRPWNRRAFQLLMVLFVVSGVIGILLHFQAKVEFKLEVNPSLEGMELFREVIVGASLPPILAPGTMIQMGLLGLLCASRLLAPASSSEISSSKILRKQESPMNLVRSSIFIFAVALLLAGGLAETSHAQLGRQQGLVEPNMATEKELSALPHMTPALVKGIVEQRPFLSMTALNDYLAKSLNAEQRTELYRRMFVHINLNEATPEEILLIPGMGKRMQHEFEEYRPYRSLVQFRREIGKYVDEKEVARLEQYVFVPLDLNTASEADILTIPGAGRKVAHEFEEYRPYTSMQQFRKEMGKYWNEKEVSRLERYVTINK